MNEQPVPNEDIQAKPKKKPRKKAMNDPIQKELASIKRLLCILLMKAGASQNEIAHGLGIDRADLSRMLPAKMFKPFSGVKL